MHFLSLCKQILVYVSAPTRAPSGSPPMCVAAAHRVGLHRRFFFQRFPRIVRFRERLQPKGPQDICGKEPSNPHTHSIQKVDTQLLHTHTLEAALGLRRLSPLSVARSIQFLNTCLSRSWYEGAKASSLMLWTKILA